MSLVFPGQDLICSQKFYSRNGSGDNVSATAEVGVAVSEALLAWAEADYVNAVAKMTPIRSEKGEKRLID